MRGRGETGWKQEECMERAQKWEKEKKVGNEAKVQRGQQRRR